MTLSSSLGRLTLLQMVPQRECWQLNTTDASYLDEIKEPMDLGTISKKIDQKKYKTMGDLAYDIELVIKK